MDLQLHAWIEGIPDELLGAGYDGVLARSVVFVLVATRLIGFFVAWPLIERGLLTWPIKVSMILLLTLIVTPCIELPSEISPQLQVVSHQAAQEQMPLSSPTADSKSWSAQHLATAIICNAAVGASLALSLAIFLAGLNLAGEWIDRHSGLGMGQVLNPEYSSGDSGPAKLMSLFGIAVILTMLPMNGHLHAVRLILDSFHSIPVDHTELPDSIFSLLTTVMHQSLIFGLRMALPFVVAMSLLDLTLSWIRRSSRWELASIAFTLRAAASLLVIAATLPGVQEAVTSSVQETFELAASGDSETLSNRVHEQAK